MAVLDGKVALNTGGTSGVGLSAASIFAHEGAQVVIIGRDAGKGASVEAELRATGADALFIAADITVEADVRRFAEKVRAAYGRVDVAFLNAGVTSTGKRIADLTVDEFSATIGRNLTGAFLCLKHLIPLLSSPGGAVVFTSSIASISGSPNRSDYAAAKGGLNSFARAAAMELAPSGIRVNAIVPAGILTPMSLSYMERVAHIHGSAEAALAYSNALHPLGRMAQPEDIARAA